MTCEGCAWLAATPYAGWCLRVRMPLLCVPWCDIAEREPRASRGLDMAVMAEEARRST